MFGVVRLVRPCEDGVDLVHSAFPGGPCLDRSWGPETQDLLGHEISLQLQGVHNDRGAFNRDLR